MASSFMHFACFPYDLATGKHNFAVDQYNVALTNVLPDVLTDNVLADINDPRACLGYPASGKSVLITIGKDGPTKPLETYVKGDPVVFKAQGGLIGPFQWAVLFNYSGSNRGIVAAWQYLHPVTLYDTETLTVTFTNLQEIFRIVPENP